MSQQILCVRRTTFAEALGGIPLGLTTDEPALRLFQDVVAAAGEFRPRPALEEDPTFLQVIVQGMVVKEGAVLALFRKVRESEPGRFVETRHNAKVALSSGGHVEPVEAGAGDVLRAALIRELQEELVCDPSVDVRRIRPLGLVCTASPNAELFHRVHIGFVSLVPVAGSVRLPDDGDEFDRLEFATADALRALLPRMEGWGRILAAAILDGRLMPAVLAQP